MRKAAAAAAKAVSLAGRTTPPEQALIRAVARRYAATPPADRAPLDKAYAEAMAEAARAFPNNDTIQVLYAESLMDLSPWDYRQAGGAQPKNRTADMLAALERVLERNPSHRAPPDPGPDFVLVKAMWHYARAVGYARKGMQAEGARDHADGTRRGTGTAGGCARQCPCRHQRLP